MNTTAATLPQLETEEVQALTNRTTELADTYDDFTINNVEEYEAGAQHLRTIKSMQKEVETQRTDITGPMVRAQRAANDFFRPFADRLKKAETAVKRAMGVWKAEQDRIAREEQRKRDKAAREEREEKERQANEARSKGRHARAASLEDQASQTVAPVVESQAPKTEGVSYRTVYKFRIVDETQVPRKYLVVDETKIRKVVQALGKDAEIPGVEIYPEQVVAARA